MKSRIVVLCDTNVPLKSLHLNGCTKGFHPQILILDLQYMLPKLNLEVHEWLYLSSILLWQSFFSYSLFLMNHGFSIPMYSTKTNLPSKKSWKSQSLCAPKEQLQFHLNFCQSQSLGWFRTLTFFWSLNHLHQLKCHNLKGILHFNRSGIRRCVALVFAWKCPLSALFTVPINATLEAKVSCWHGF